MSNASDRFTIIHKTDAGRSETLATGLTEKQARQWLAGKAAEMRQSVTSDLVVNAPASGQEESWHAVRAE